MVINDYLQGQREYLGRVVIQPVVRMTTDSEKPLLESFAMERYSKPAGELLGAFELIRVCLYYVYWPVSNQIQRKSILDRC